MRKVVPKQICTAGGSSRFLKVTITGRILTISLSTSYCQESEQSPVQSFKVVAILSFEFRSFRRCKHDRQRGDYRHTKRRRDQVEDTTDTNHISTPRRQLNEFSPETKRYRHDKPSTFLKYTKVESLSSRGFTTPKKWINNSTFHPSTPSLSHPPPSLEQN